MKTSTILFISLLILLSLCSCKKPPIQIAEDETKTDILRIYCSDSFAQTDIGTKAIPIFEKQYSCKVELYIIPSDIALLDRLIAEKDAPRVDIAIGIRNIQRSKALDNGIFQPYEPPTARNIRDQSLLIDRRYLLTPIAHSYYAFLYDKEIVIDPPKTFGEFQSTVWRDKIMLLDPNVSSTGYAVLLWSLGVYSDRGFNQFWRAIKPNIMMVAENRSDVYTALQTGEAPIVLSNLTSAAYFKTVERLDRYETFIPREGGLKEIEYAGILNNATNLYLARRFMDFLLSADFQRYVPTSLWMFPVIEGVELPLSFADYKPPTFDLTDKIFDRKEYFQPRWINLWLQIMEE